MVSSNSLHHFSRSVPGAITKQAYARPAASQCTADMAMKMRAKSDDLVAMIDGEMGLMSSFLSGRVRVDAPLSDLLALRKLG